MKRKFKLSSKHSKKMFTKGATRTRTINTIRFNPMRGGFRI
jgi:hypothetical protein